MQRLDLQTPDFTSANIARIAELFPNCVTEKKNPDGTLKRAIDFDLLSQELSHDLVEGPQERYRLDWPGKRAALALANEPIRKTLRPNRDESVNFDTTQNLYLEGDNLDALKLLQETYLGQVKMMYIDPPYNTGNDFIYEDDFTAEKEAYQRGVGEKDDEGNRMMDEERWKQNTTSNGRFHSDWLSMIYPRLKLARNLLADDGLIFSSIDDNELSNLMKIMSEVFGDDNFVANFAWEKRTNRENRKTVSYRHDSIVCFRKAKCEAKALYQLPLTERALGDYKNPDNDSRGLWKSDPAHAQAGHGTKSQFYEVIAPNGRIHHLESGRCWVFTESVMKQKIEDKMIYFGKDGNGVPRIKTYLESKDRGLTPETILFSEDASTNEEAKNSLKELFDGIAVFETPKPTQLLSILLRVSTKANDVVLDFFSGSSVTAHAVMQLNADDGGKRRHIMVQLPEPCDEKSEAFKAGYKTIAEIGKERIRRAGKKILEEWQAKQAKEKSKESDLLTPSSEIPVPHSPPDIGFRVLKVDSSNMADVYYQPDELTQDTLALHVDNLKPGRKPEDLLFQVLLDWGVDLALPITEEKIKGRRVFFVDDSGEPAAHPALAACFDTGLDEDFVKILAKRAPLRAVFRDAGYASDAVKINIEQIFKALSPHTELKTL
ncbi:MAG: hypothetical protein RLZZ398_567 [Verrucomicrobiota bacterium]|jgi:adenine-specific DNA-methyltransferase